MKGWGGVGLGVSCRGGEGCNHKIRVQECNGGGAMSTQCDWHDRGWGVSYRGGLSWKVTSLRHWTNTSVLLSPSLTFQLKLKVYVFLPIFQSI